MCVAAVVVFGGAVVLEFEAGFTESIRSNISETLDYSLEIFSSKVLIHSPCESFPVGHSGAYPRQS